MKINEIAMRHNWDLGSKIKDMVNSYNMDKNSLRILKSIEKEFYDSDDVITREKIAMDRIKKELPLELAMYMLRYS